MSPRGSSAALPGPPFSAGSTFRRESSSSGIAALGAIGAALIAFRFFVATMLPSLRRRCLRWRVL